MPRPTAPHRQDFLYFERQPTRWNDNDVYGHINNAVYYFFFDTLVNNYLLKNSLLSIEESAVIGLVAETQCQYYTPLKHPMNIDMGLAASRIGRTSVTYKIGLFAPGHDIAAASGHFVHVYVDAETRCPTALTGSFKSALRKISLKPD